MTLEKPKTVAVDRLLRALEPFAAEWADMGVPSTVKSDKLMLDTDPGGEILTVGHWRELMAAYASLSRQNEEKPNG